MRSRTVNQFSSAVIGAGRSICRRTVRPVLPADQEHVAEPFGRDERDRLPRPLEQRVGRDRRAVNDVGRAIAGCRVPPLRSRRDENPGESTEL